MSEETCTVRCEGCGAERRVSFAEHLTHGWPEHCGRTVTLLDVDDGAIDAAVDAIFAPVRAIRQASESTR
jgi:hypothetical protein